jgi:hypothetical protein
MRLFAEFICLMTIGAAAAADAPTAATTELDCRFDATNLTPPNFALATAGTATSRAFVGLRAAS